MLQLLSLVQTARVDHAALLQALSLGWDEFEAAVRAAAARNAGATRLITRTPRIFAGLTVPVLTLEEFLAAQERE